MKQKDIALIIVVVFVSVILSVVVSKIFITAPKNRQQQVEMVTPISADFASPDKRYFNQASVDPTQLIKIGEDSNKSPFNTNQ